MGIYLEKYSKIKSPKQGHDIHRLVSNNYSRLLKDPDRIHTASRYNGLVKAIGNVARIATSEGLQAYIIRERKHSIAIGLATIIFDQSVIHPEVRVVSGNNLDYWLDCETTGYVHRKTAEELVLANRYLTEEFVPTDPYGGEEIDMVTNYPALFVAVQDDSTISPTGFTYANELHVDDYLQLKPLGEPAKLSVLAGQKDEYGVAAIGRTTQLYFREASRYPVNPR